MTVSGGTTTHGIPKFADIDVPDLAAGGLGTILDTLDGLLGLWKPGSIVVGGGGSALIDFNPLATGFSHLLVVASVRSDRAGTIDSLGVRLNGDGGANYNWNLGEISGTPALTGAGSISDSSFDVLDMPCAGSPAGSFGALALFIPHYLDAVNHKSLIALGGADQNATAATLVANVSFGRWKSAAASNRLTLLSRNAANFVSGSTATVYYLA